MLAGSRGPYPYHEGKHLIVAIDLYAYADESGIQGSAPYCLMAGYIASPRRWKPFNAAWKATLEEYGVPEFHAKDFFAVKKRHRVGVLLNRAGFL